tara:strand:+ start:1702 stop:2100 length:399 start_codon:yes stop_codon:yes gene_type:complete
MSSTSYSSSYSTLNRETNNEVVNKGFNLPNTIRNITFHFIKVHYNKYLEDNNVKKIGKEKIPEVVNELYEEKETELKKYIRGTMRKNFPDYDKNFTLKTSTEEIILEMFDDPEFSKNRIIIEIENYQRKIQG